MQRHQAADRRRALAHHDRHQAKALVALNLQALPPRSRAPRPAPAPALAPSPQPASSSARLIASTPRPSAQFRSSCRHAHASPGRGGSASLANQQVTARRGSADRAPLPLAADLLAPSPSRSLLQEKPRFWQLRLASIQRGSGEPLQIFVDLDQQGLWRSSREERIESGTESFQGLAKPPLDRGLEDRVEDSEDEGDDRREKLAR